MAARSRFNGEGKDNGPPEGFTLRRSNTYNLLASRWKSFRRRRIIFVLLAGWLLYLFFKYMPTDVPPVSERYDPRYGRLRGGQPETRVNEPQDSSQISGLHEGPIKYYELANTLRPQMSKSDPRRNILFAVSSLESMPHLLPIACSMSSFNKTRVHLAYMGRDVADWYNVRKMNGIAESSCDIILHDARPDFAAKSSASRLEVSARAVLGHVHSALQLHMVLTADNEEEGYLSAVRAKTLDLGLSLLNLPAGGLQSLSWISSLDAQSLSQFDKVQIDIVIQAQPESAASLLRLLRSIEKADYTGFQVPRLTVELPNNVDPFLSRYLSTFQWPANSMGSESRLVVRHRLDGRLMSTVQASMRTVESFYPLTPTTSHVLILAPSVELAPNYFQFLMYAVLEYKYGAGSAELVAPLMGVSLDLPLLAPDLKTKAPYESHLDDPLILWQAPTSNAALYFGDRWMEFHTFLSYRLLLDVELAHKTPSSPTLSQEFPTWLQPLHEMMQARGYYMIYPTFMLKEGSSALTVHRELSQPPEEFMLEANAKTTDNREARLDLANEGKLTADAELALLMKAEQRAFPASLVIPLLEAMVEKGGELVSSIPLFSFNGEQRERAYSWSIAWKAAREFALSVGRCESYDSDSKGDSDFTNHKAQKPRLREASSARSFKPSMFAEKCMELVHKLPRDQPAPQYETAVASTVSGEAVAEMCHACLVRDLRLLGTNMTAPSYHTMDASVRSAIDMVRCKLGWENAGRE